VRARVVGVSPTHEYNPARGGGGAPDRSAWCAAERVGECGRTETAERVSLSGFGGGREGGGGRGGGTAQL